MPARSCESCGEHFEARRSTARYCSSRCRVRASRANAAARAAAVESDPPPSAAPSAASGGLVETAVRAELEAAGKASTALGLSTMLLARWLDNAEREPLAARATMQKRLAESLSELVDGKAPAEDPMDELRAARERKHAG